MPLKFIIVSATTAVIFRDQNNITSTQSIKLFSIAGKST